MITISPQKNIVASKSFELLTFALWVRCSTDWATRRFVGDEGFKPPTYRIEAYYSIRWINRLFVSCSRIQLLPNPCKRFTLPLRQQEIRGLCGSRTPYLLYKRSVLTIKLPKPLRGIWDLNPIRTAWQADILTIWPIPHFFEQLAGLEPALFLIGSQIPYLLGESCILLE